VFVTSNRFIFADMDRRLTFKNNLHGLGSEPGSSPLSYNSPPTFVCSPVRGSTWVISQPANVRLGWKWLTVTNALAYNSKKFIAIVKRPHVLSVIILTALSQGILKGDVSLYSWPLVDWFGISRITTDNFCFYLINRLNQTSKKGGQWYSDTSPLWYSLVKYLFASF